MKNKRILFLLVTSVFALLVLLSAMKRFFTLFIFAFFASSIFAQSFDLNQGSIQQKKYLQKIPYQNIDGKLIVPVIIDGKTYNFIFDTGAPLTISDKIYKELNLQIITQTEVTDASDRKMGMKCILLPELHLQGITFINTPGFVHHEASSDFVNLFECFEIDGTIGSNMLRNSAVQIDEKNKHIIIANSIIKIPGKKGLFQKMELHPKSSCPYIGIGLQKRVQKEKSMIGDIVLFDTGTRDFYEMSMHHFDWFNSRVDITKIAESEGSFAWSAHGFDENQQHLLLSIPDLDINKTIFSDVVITTTNDAVSRIGSKLLEYGKVTLDYKNKRFHFLPFENINADELSERPRAILPTWQNDKLVVGIIWDKALEPQINLGDEILSIDGVDIQSMDICEFFNYFSSFSNTSPKVELILELKDIKTGKVKKVEIKRL